MLLLRLASATLAAPTVHLTATDTAGATLLDVEAPLPYETTVVSGKAALSLFVASYHGHRAVLELAAGRQTKEGVRIKVETSVELDVAVPADSQITWRKVTFHARTVLGNPTPPPLTVPARSWAVRFVRVWDDASLLASPRQPNTATRERELPGGRTDPAGQASPMEVVDTWGTTHLEAETVPDAGPEHCAPGGPPAAAWPLQAYVALTDVAPVTTRALSARFPDGSGYEVPPGTPVTDRSAGRGRVSGRGLVFDVEVADTDVGTFYVPGEVRPMGQTDWVVGPGVVGATALGEVRWTGNAPLPVSGIEGLERPIAVLRDGCLEARVPLTGPGAGPSTSP
jgi:hypothetical protein